MRTFTPRKIGGNCIPQGFHIMSNSSSHNLNMIRSSLTVIFPTPYIIIVTSNINMCFIRLYFEENLLLNNGLFVLHFRQSSYQKIFPVPKKAHILKTMHFHSMKNLGHKHHLHPQTNRIQGKQNLTGNQQDSKLKNVKNT